MLDYPSPHFNSSTTKFNAFPRQRNTSKRDAPEAHGLTQPKTITATELQLTNIIHQSSKLVHNQYCLHHFKKEPFRITLAVLAFPGHNRENKCKRINHRLSSAYGRFPQCALPEKHMCWIASWRLERCSSELHRYHIPFPPREWSCPWITPSHQNLVPRLKHLCKPRNMIPMQNINDY